MTLEGTYVPSSLDWVRDQVAEYEASGGTRATTLQDVPVVIITSRGAKSGHLRKNPVMRVEHDGSYLAIASKGGAEDNPSWFHNLVAHPEVDLQDGPDKHTYTARRLSGDERAAWWQRAVAVWPAYDDYAARTDREIPVFLLERT